MHINRKGLQFSKRDTFDYSTLSIIIIEWLKRFKEDHSSHPFSGCPSCYIEHPLPSHPTDEEIQKGRDQFYSDIDEMIWAFEVDDMPDDCWLIEPKLDDMLSGKLDFDKIDAHTLKIEAGRKLFAEKFADMWI